MMSLKSVSYILLEYLQTLRRRRSELDESRG